jgi:dephospho-CoA kinase
MNKPRIVALTGGIGSGKTTILKLFKEKGVPCYIADEQAKKLMVENHNVIASVKNEFGEDAYNKEGQLNTNYLASQVFSNKQKLEKLNSIVHPAVRSHFIDWVKEQTFQFVIYESALVFENHQEESFDDIILVTAPVKERIKRVIKRNGISKDDIKKRMNRQMDDNLNINKATYIINNIKYKDLKYKVDIIYREILNKINKKS